MKSHQPKVKEPRTIWFLNYFWFISDAPILVWNMSEIILKYFWNISEIFLKYFSNMFDYWGFLLLFDWHFAIFLVFLALPAKIWKKKRFLKMPSKKKIRTFSEIHWYLQGMVCLDLAKAGSPDFWKKSEKKSWISRNNVIFPDFGWEKQEKQRKVAKVYFFPFLCWNLLFSSLFLLFQPKSRKITFFLKIQIFLQKEKAFFFQIFFQIFLPIFFSFFSRHVFK